MTEQQKKFITMVENVPQNLVEQFRVMVYKYAQAHTTEIDIDDVHNRITPPDSFIDSISETSPSNTKPKTIKTKDWMLKRILCAAKQPLNLDSAMERFIEIFRFRAQFPVSKLTMANSLPLEFFSLMAAEFNGYCRHGSLVGVVRIRLYRRIAQFDEIICRAAMYLLEQEDIRWDNGDRDHERGRSDYCGVTIVIDCRDFDFWRSINLGLMKFMIKLAYYYPNAIMAVLIYALPWKYQFVLQLIKGWIKSFTGFPIDDLFHLVNDQSDFYKFIEPDQLPQYLYGTKPQISEYEKIQARPEQDMAPLPFDEMVRLLIDQGIMMVEEKNFQQMSKYIKNLMHENYHPHHGSNYNNNNINIEYDNDNDNDNNNNNNNNNESA